MRVFVGSQNLVPKFEWDIDTVTQAMGSEKGPYQNSW